jgi:hypothetical protein
VSFAAIILCVASQRVIPKVSVYFVIDSVRKLLDTPSYKRINMLRLFTSILSRWNASETKGQADVKPSGMLRQTQ